MKKIILVLAIALNAFTAVADDSSYSEVHRLAPGGAWASPDGNHVEWGLQTIDKGAMRVTVNTGTSLADVITRATADCRRAYPASGFGASDSDMHARNCRRSN